MCICLYTSYNKLCGMVMKIRTLVLIWHVLSRCFTFNFLSVSHVAICSEQMNVPSQRPQVSHFPSPLTQ